MKTNLTANRLPGHKLINPPVTGFLLGGTFLFGVSMLSVYGAIRGVRPAAESVSLAVAVLAGGCVCVLLGLFIWFRQAIHERVRQQLFETGDAVWLKPESIVFDAAVSRPGRSLYRILCGYVQDGSFRTVSTPPVPAGQAAKIMNNGYEILFFIDPLDRNRYLADIDHLRQHMPEMD